MKRVTGLGGVFFKAEDPKALSSWYAERLGIEPSPDGIAIFEWREKDQPDTIGYTVFNPFPKTTKYFEPSRAPFMLNFRVDDLAALLEALRAEGVTVDENMEESEFGKFGWVMDPEGNRIELWEPPKQG